MKALLVVLACVATVLGEDKRVVGGVPAKRGGNPYMAAIFSSSGNYKCSGVLIHRSWVATAGSCVADATKGSLKVRLGDYSLSGRDGTEQTYGVYARAMTGYQTTSGYPNNIALLKLVRPANINAAVRPLTMPRPTQSFAGETCYIVGWGKTSADSTHSDVLNTARAIPITNNACNSAWSGVTGASIFTSHLCAQNNGIQTCNGDSGSPLVCGNTLAGIASWGDKSCEGKHPFVYTRVSSYLSWINNIIAKH